MSKQEGDMRACELWKGKGKGREGKGKCNYKLIKKTNKNSCYIQTIREEIAYF